MKRTGLNTSLGEAAGREDGSNERDSLASLSLSKNQFALTQTKSLHSTLKQKRDREDAPWAEVAKFNKLLDMKIQLD